MSSEKISTTLHFYPKERPQNSNDMLPASLEVSPLALESFKTPESIKQSTLCSDVGCLPVHTSRDAWISSHELSSRQIYKRMRIVFNDACVHR